MLPTGTVTENNPFVERPGAGNRIVQLYRTIHWIYRIIRSLDNEEDESLVLRLFCSSSTTVESVGDHDQMRKDRRKRKACIPRPRPSSNLCLLYQDIQQVQKLVSCCCCSCVALASYAASCGARSARAGADSNTPPRRPGISVVYPRRIRPAHNQRIISSGARAPASCMRAQVSLSSLCARSLPLHRR